MREAHPQPMNNEPRSVCVWTPERVPLTLPLAGLGERAAAYLIDLILLVLASFALLFVYNFWGDIENGTSRSFLRERSHFSPWV